jgi:protein-S-isoprenylcysteine O-methyltransferase Ste14
VLGSSALVCLIAFLFNLLPENPLPGNVDGVSSAAPWLALLFDAGLTSLFGVQHSAMIRPCTPAPFRSNTRYRYLRDPIMTGVFIGIWVTPVMTTGRLLFAVGMSLYLFIGVYHEEKDLLRAFGDRYLSYMKSTGRFLPLPAKSATLDNVTERTR